MDNYALQSDEVVLYKNECQLSGEKAELILTNLNVVFIKKTQEPDEQVVAEAYPIDEIKIYKGVHQIKQNGSQMEIFFTGGEKTIDLFSKNEAGKFINKALELLTDKNRVQRASDKVKGAIGLVDNTIGINSVEALKNAAGKSLFGAAVGIGKKILHKSSGISSLTEAIGATRNSLSKEASKPKTEESTSVSVDSLETLKKLKSLMDEGIITQGEFDTKKKQILGLS